MEKKTNLALDYANLRKMQSTLVRCHAYFTGDLMNCYEAGVVRRYSEHLVKTFFPATEGLIIREDLLRLFRVFLVMAPKLQQNKARLDWHQGHILTWIRRTANRNACRWYLKEEIVKRRHDPEMFLENLRFVGFKDDTFNHKVIELFKRYYTATGQKGHLANRIFDPVMFFSLPIEGHSIKVGDHVYRAEKDPFDGSQDIREGITICDVHMKYGVKMVRGETGRRIDQNIPEERLTVVRSTVSRIIGRRYDHMAKVREIEKIIGQFAEDARFAKSAYHQINDLAFWLKQKLKPLVSPSYKKAAQIPDLLKDHWRVRSQESNIFWVNKSNFFWDYNKVEERVYRHFFSPYQWGS